MSTRFCYARLDQIAKENKARIIHPDRPGIGGSDPVKLEERISVWLSKLPPSELVPSLRRAHRRHLSRRAALPKKSVWGRMAAITSALYRFRLIRPTPCGPARRIPVCLHPTY